MNTKIKSLSLLALLLLAAVPTAGAWEHSWEWVAGRYRFERHLVPMRDGTRLFTQIAIPLDTLVSHPVIIERTPYGALRDSAALRGVYSPFARAGYIVVTQDVRGKHLSEGEFENMRPMHHCPDSVDEGTDTWDTIDWLLCNVPGNNGRVGLIGTSYPGFYAVQGALCGHPALRAVVPQAPCYDWFAGDDFHHNGAFMLFDAVDFIRFFHSRRGDSGGQFATEDAYREYMALEPLRHIDRYYADTISFWPRFGEHPHYDDYWRSHSLAAQCRDSLQCAVMVMGGSYDAEDCYGTFALYERLQPLLPARNLHLTVGPWFHGGWYYDRLASLGDFYLGEQLYSYYEEQLLMPFLNHHLMGEGEPPAAGATLFFTGENRWRHLPDWPRSAQALPLYLHGGGKLSHRRPSRRGGQSSYLSDPAHPVPFTAAVSPTRDAAYMVEDQRFLQGRTDLLTFVAEPLADTLRLAGSIEAELWVTIEEGDEADFVVKLIDIYPDDFAYTPAQRDSMMARGEVDLLAREEKLRGFYFPVRMEVLRGRYRDGLGSPRPFVPGEPTPVKFTLPPVAHTLLPGHRLAVQVQSSWFPLVDLNPHRYVENLYRCDTLDLSPSRITLHHSRGRASRLLLPAMR